MNSQRTYWHLLTGGIAGGVSRTVTSPFERLKIVRQCGTAEYRGLSARQAFARCYSREGLRGFFKGNGYNVVKVVPFTAIEFYAFEKLKQQFGHSKPSLFLSGSLAGSLATILTYPLDLFKTLSSVQVNQPVRGSIYRSKGLWGLYRGLGMSIVGISPFIGLKMTLFDLLKSQTDPSLSNNFLLGGIAGGLAMFLTYPTDLIRRKIQVSVVEQTNSSISECVRLLYRTEGIFGFYRGLLPSFMKITPTMAVVFAINEQLKNLFQC